MADPCAPDRLATAQPLAEGVDKQLIRRHELGQAVFVGPVDPRNEPADDDQRVGALPRLWCYGSSSQRLTSFVGRAVALSDIGDYIQDGVHHGQPGDVPRRNSQRSPIADSPLIV